MEQKVEIKLKITDSGKKMLLLFDELENFIESNRKVCWESEFENGQHCIGEDKVRAFVNKLIPEVGKLSPTEVESQELQQKCRIASEQFHLTKKNQMSDKATDKPLTLEQCKDKVAKKAGFIDFNSMMLTHVAIYTINQVRDQAAELYKDSALEAQKGEIERLKADIKKWEDAAVEEQRIMIQQSTKLLKEIEALKQQTGNS